MPYRTDPCRAMYRQSDVPIDTEVCLSRVDAHPHLQSGPARPRVLRDCPLARSRSENGILGTVEGDEEGVALVVDLLTAVRCECFAEQPAVLGQDVCVLAAVRLEQLRRAFDIREQETLRWLASPRARQPSSRTARRAPSRRRRRCGRT